MLSDSHADLRHEVRRKTVGPFDLAAQYRDLVAQQQDFDGLGGVGTG